MKLLSRVAGRQPVCASTVVKKAVVQTQELAFTFAIDYPSDTHAHAISAAANAPRSIVNP